MPVAVITAYGGTDNAVRALKLGAFDYRPKPISLEQLRPGQISPAVDTPPAANQSATSRFLGNSPALQQVRELIESWREQRAGVHHRPNRDRAKARSKDDPRTERPRRRPFVPVNCGAIPET